MPGLVEIESFGGLDADTDQLLDSCFEDHEAYVSALAHQKFLILGRKGSGKTAIYRKLLGASRYNLFTFGHNFLDYPWHHHDKQEAVGVPEEERFVHSWKYLIFLTLAKILLNQDGSQPWSEDAQDALGKLEKFVVDSYGTRDPEVTQIFAPQNRLSLRPLFEVSLGVVKINVEANRLPMDRLPTQIQEVNDNLSKAIMTSLNPQFDYYVCLDQLDLGFDPTNSRYRNRLVGLLLAARDTNLKAQQYGKKLSVIIFLRDDIYQTLQFEDKNKLTEAFSTRIEWDTPRTDKKLKQLMEKRFSAILSPCDLHVWDGVFDETEKMTGKQTKYNHMLDRTFLRPRDMIKFTNEVLRAHKNRQQLPGIETIGRSPKFDNRDITTTRVEYSSYFLNELDDEIFKHFPDYKQFIEVLKVLDSLQFDMADFAEAMAKRKQILPTDVHPTTVLKKLFDFSVIAYYSPGGAGYGGSEYVWRYQDVRAQFNETATAFRVHPALKEVLGLRKFTKSD